MSMDDSEILSFRKKLLFSFYFFILTLTIGTIGYWLIGEGRYSLLDCFYMTVITIATVGYREVVEPISTANKIFTIILIFAGMSVILYFMSNITAFLIEGNIKEIFWRKKMQKFIDRMKNHYIVCGVGRLGWHIIDELHQTGRPTVAIDTDPAQISLLKEKFPNIGTITGDSTDNDVLVSAGISRAAGLVVATGHDKDNLVVTLSARQSCPELRIVTRCNEIKNTDKLKRAGADSVVSSNLIGGLRMVSEMIRPTVVTFLDKMLRDKEKNLRIEGIEIPANSKLIGRHVGDLKKHALLLAIQRKDGTYEYNPADTILMEEGMSIIFMGSPEDRTRLESIVMS